MNHSDTLSKIAPSMVKALAELKAAQMDSTNKFLGNRYASLGSVIEAERSVLAKHDLGITQIVTNNELYWIGVETIIWHSSGEWISGTVSMPLPDEQQKGRSMAQEAGAIISYLRRYGLSGILNLYADEDTDGALPPQRAEKQAQIQARARMQEEYRHEDPEEIQEPALTPKRPYTPEQVKLGLTKLATDNPRNSLTDKQRNLLRYGLDLCFAGQDQETVEFKRHVVLEFLTGDPSSRTLDPAMGKAIMDGWLKITKDEESGEYQVDAMAAREAERIATAGLVDSGQETLPL